MNESFENEEQVYGQLIAQQRELRDKQQPQSMLADEENRYKQAIQQNIDQRDEVLRQSLMVSVSKDPDQMAQLQKLSDKTGMPLELVQKNVAKLINQDRVNALKESARYSPILAQQLSDPNFAMLAFDDYESLSGLESVVTKGRDWAGSLLKGPTTFAGTTTRGFGELYGIGVRNLEAGLDQVLPNSAMSFLRTPIPMWADPGTTLISGGKALSNYGKILGAPVQRQGLDTDVLEGIGQLGGQIALFLTAGPVVATTSLYASGAGIMAEKIEKDDATRAQKDAAIITGAGITGITERYGLGQILNRLPPKIRNRTLRFIADKASTYGIEFAQEITEGLLHDLTRRVFTNENAPILEGAIREGNAAGIAAAIVRAALGVRSFRNAQQQQQFFEALGDSAKASKLRERMPERFQSLVEKFTQGGPVKQVFVPAEQFQTYFQSQNVDPAIKANELGVPNYMEALAAGTDIIIPMDQFTTKVAPTDDLQGLMQDIRLAQGEMTPRELELYKADEEARLQEILDDARRSVGEIQTPQLLVIKDEMQQQLVATGYEQTTAEAYATVYAKTISNLAERAGMDAKTLHDKYSLSVTRPLPEVLTRDRRTDTQLDPLLDRLRKGDLPKEQDVYGKSLVDFLIEQGGLKPVGEMVDVDIGRGPFQRNLIQEMGMDADAAAQLAVEYGYLQGRGYEDVTERDLFDAIEDELAGARQYSVEQTNEQLLALQTQLEELSRVLEQLGIDITQITDNAEIRRLLEQATQAPEIRDAIEPLFQAIPAEEGFNQWSKGYPVIELDQEHSFQSGESIVVESIHGTTADITAFDVNVANIESDLGGGIYSTNSTDDAQINYAGKGPDLTNKIQQLAERIATETDRDYDDPDVLSEATQQFMVNEGVSMPIYVRFDNPIVIGKSGETFLEYDEQYNEEFDEYEEPTGLLVDFIEAFRDIASDNRYSDVNIDETINDLMQAAIDNGGIKVSDLIDVLSKSEGLAYATDSQFDEALESKDIIRRTFESMGFDGFIDQTVARKFSRMEGMDDTTVHFIAFNPEQIASRIGGTWQRGEVGAEILKQEERGFIQFGPERKFNITLLERADLSTFLHETGHFYLEVLGDLAQGAEANPQLQDDYQTVLNFLGLKSRDELTLDGKDPSSAEYQKAVAAHEKFARANEAYLMEGKAPSAELRSIFQRFRQWLKMIYKDFTRLDVKLTNQVREVFDRIYATDQEIESAQSEGSFDPLFLDAAAAGMTEAEFQAYKESARQAGESAKDSLQAKLIKEMQREREAWWKQELSNVKDEVAKEFDELPAYKAFKELTEGEIKLNKKELIDLYGTEYLKRLPRGFQRVYTRKEGMPLEAAAREFGFPSGDSLIEALIGLPNRKEYIDAEAERRMLERHGDMMTDGSIADEAVIALHNNHRESVLMAELRALRRKQREVRPFVRAAEAEARAQRAEMQAEVQAERAQARGERAEMRAALDIPPANAFRQAAKGLIGQTAIRDIQPQRFLNAQRKHGKAAEKAILAGDSMAAADAKQKELLNHFLYLEARKARDRSESIAKYITKFEKKSTRERIGKAGQIYLEQIDAILDGYEFRRIPNRKIDRRATLQAFVDGLKAKETDIPSEEPVNIPASVLEDARQINYRLLSYDELQAVNEAVRNIENLASLKNRLSRIAEKRELDEVARQALDTLESNSKGALAKKLESALPADRPKRFLKGFMLLHTKFATMMRQMDGWKDDGTFWNLFVRPLNQAADYEAVKRADATKALSDIFKQYRDVSLFSKMHIKSLGQSMTLQGRLMVALNWGRAENRQRVMDGNGLSQSQVDEILGTLDERDWKVVQDIWKLIDSYWSDIETQYKELYGTAPAKSETLSINTKYGVIEGGYFPIKYDPTKTAQAQAQTADEILNQMKSGAYMRSQTKNGFTKEVLEKLDRPIKLDLSSLYEHLGEVVHDLALREYLLDANKLMNHRVDGTTLKQAIIDTYGDQFYGEIRDTLRDVAIGDIGARGAFEQSMSHLRAGVSIAGMGWNLMTGLMQPLGLTQSFVRIGPQWVSKGLMKWGMDAVGLQNSAKWIYEKSDFMRTRNMTQNREISEIRNQIKRQGRFPMARQAWGVIEDSYFQLIIQGQKLVDIPTWLGAYEKALSQGKDDATATALADQAVIDSQGGGSVKDLAAIQRGGPLLKLWTNFYSYFNTTFNLTKEVIGRTKFNDPISIGRAGVDLVMLYSVPVILGEALREAVKVFVTGEEPDEEELITKLQTAHLSYLLGTVVGLREFSTAFDPRFGYSGPAGVRFIADFNRFAAQVSQGELDDALRKATVSTVGTLLHYPAGQINRIIDGIYGLQDGRAESPAALIFGVPK